MRFKKIFIGIILTIAIININKICFAKYAIEYIEKAIEIEIRN